MTNTTQDLNSIREINTRLFALKLNIGGILTTEKRLRFKEDVGAGPYRSRPIRSAVVGLARRTPPVLGVIITARRLIVDTGYSSSADCSFLGLRMLGPPSSKIWEFSTSRSAMAVAMVVLNKMLPHSENGELVVMTVLRCSA
jgi:hypothetical protein